MRRDLGSIPQKTFDLIIIGGGIYGACIAWEASLRGLTVALFEKKDFGAATSANSLKTIHGGFRYLQSADFVRIRESVTERRVLMQIAPHLVHPLPVLLPTYGHGLRGREALSVGLLLYELISIDRNKIKDPEKHIPPGRTLSAGQCLELLPGLPDKNLTGGVLFYDAQIYNSERLVLAFAKSAYEIGATVVNYAEVSDLIVEDERVTGVKVLDHLTGDLLEVRSNIVVNASGPWIGCLLNKLRGRGQEIHFPLARAVNIVTRKIFEKNAIGLPGENCMAAEGENGKGKGSYLFVAPWRDYSIAGTVYSINKDSPDQIRVTEEEIDFLVNEINQAYPPANLHQGDVYTIHAGLLPKVEAEFRKDSIQLSNHYRIIDHRSQGIKGLISVEGVKYTTARDVAVKLIDQVFTTFDVRPPKSRSNHIALVGGQIDCFDEFLENALQKRPDCLDVDQVRMLVLNYGSDYWEFIKYFSKLAEGETPLSGNKSVLQAQINYAVQEEMAIHLTDILFRRTELGSAGFPGIELLNFSAEIMAKECGWDQKRIIQEIDAVNQAFPQWR